MSELFLKIVNMSISASWLVLVVLAFRFIFRKAPKWVNVLLWGIVAVRLICPFSVESALSLIPSAETISPEIIMSPVPTIQTGVPAINSVVNPVITETFAPEPIASANPLQILIPIFAIIWITGMCILALYTVISYWRLQRKVSEAVILRDNIFQSENVGSPFVLGIIKPKVYLSYNMDGQDIRHVIAHEQAHILRKDHWWKPLGFLLLTLHWFNPLMWLAYVLLCRDIELACDEKVIKKLGNEQRADYSQALVSCSVNRRMIAACPLAFGEVGVKERVKSVMNYKKPAFWVIVVSVIACTVVAVCFLTDPMGFQFNEMTHTIVSANHFDMRAADDIVAVEMNPAQISELSSRLAGVRNTKKSNEYGGFTPGYQISALLEDGTYIRISGYSLSDNDMVDIEWNGERYVVSDSEFQDYLSRICASGDVAAAESAAAGKIYVYDGEGFGGSFTITLFEDGTFTYYEGMLSSYIGTGSFMLDADTVIMSDDGHGGYGLINRFRHDGDDLVFVEQDSDNFVYVKVQDGERFHCAGEAFKQNDGTDGTVQIMPNRKLSLNDVIALSQKGYDLTWSDFDQFEYTETGSGLYIRIYEIDEQFGLMIGGAPDRTPMYIYLCLSGSDNTRIDIRDGGVEEFIGADHSEVLLTNAIHDAILSENKPSDPDGLYHCASFALLSLETVSGTPLAGAVNHMEMVTVYGLALHQGYGFSGHTFHEGTGSHIPTAITFEIADGKYVLKEYWIPRDGSYYAQDIRDKFPDEIEDDAMDTQKYIRRQKQECYDKAVIYGGVDTDYAVEYLFEVIESSPAAASRPADYIDEHPIEYRELIYYGSHTLRYIFSQFLEGGQTGLRGHLMRAVLDDIAPEARLRLHAETGQEYFDEWKAGAVRISRQHEMEWIEENQPAMYLLLQMMNG